MAIESKDKESIQSIIGYRFRNPDLLEQAFIRRSYSEENGGENNEVLEFIGDKALDLAVIRVLTEIRRDCRGRLLQPRSETIQNRD